MKQKIKIHKTYFRKGFKPHKTQKKLRKKILLTNEKKIVRFISNKYILKEKMRL